MADIKQNWKTFHVSDDVQSQYSELLKLILATDSMDDNERQYWFDIMPSMTDEQVDRYWKKKIRRSWNKITRWNKTTQWKTPYWMARFSTKRF